VKFSILSYIPIGISLLWFRIIYYHHLIQSELHQLPSNLISWSDTMDYWLLQIAASCFIIQSKRLCPFHPFAHLFHPFVLMNLLLLFLSGPELLRMSDMFFINYSLRRAVPAYSWRHRAHIPCNRQPQLLFLWSVFDANKITGYNIFWFIEYKMSPRIDSSCSVLVNEDCIYFAYLMLSVIPCWFFRYDLSGKLQYPLLFKFNCPFFDFISQFLFTFWCNSAFSLSWAINWLDNFVFLPL